MQDGGSGDLFTRLLPWLGGLLVLAVAGGVLMLWTRRMAVGPGDAGSQQGFGMDQLDAMKARGELSAEEHQRARRKLVEREAARLRRSDPASGKGR
ncbi:MAG: SHOCT domain-containing protein [Planctomycetes bacterium]|nr:SHOCT domain-containing protein [Planctomycetota bacterium]